MDSTTWENTMDTTNNKVETSVEDNIKQIVTQAVDDNDAKLVVVQWHDAVAHGYWHVPDAVVSACSTVGYMAAATEFAIEVTSTLSDGDEVNASICIPIGMITSIQQITLQEPVDSVTVH